MKSDEKLIGLVAEGDANALRELFDRHSPWVASRLRRNMPASAVEDALQETFVAVWRGAGRYGERGDVGAWIWGIARRQGALWLRKHGRSESELETVWADPAGDPVASIVRRADVDRALASLGPEGHEGRELARLVYFEDQPLADVAAHFGIPEGTVKSRLFKLRRRLRAALVEGGC